MHKHNLEFVGINVLMDGKPYVDGEQLLHEQFYAKVAGVRDFATKPPSQSDMIKKYKAIKAKGYPNPAELSTFPKILGTYAREKGLFSIENAIMRMTSASADRFGLKDIGRLQPGKASDIVIFDPDNIADSPPTNRGPYGKPQGIYHVFINGAHVVKDGSYIDSAREGRVL
mgnify:CR=1 FL=1